MQFLSKLTNWFSSTSCPPCPAQGINNPLWKPPKSDWMQSDWFIMTSSIKNWSPSNSSDFGSNWFDCLFGHMARFNHNFFANLNASLNTEQCFGFWGRGLFLMLSLVPTLLFPLQLGVTFSLSTSYLTFWVISPDFQVWLSPPCQTNKQKQKNKKLFAISHHLKFG